MSSTKERNPALLHEGSVRPDFPFPRVRSGDWLCDGEAERGEAIQDGDADLEFGGLAVEISGHEPLTQQLDAVHPLAGRALRSNVPRGFVSTRLRRW